MQLNSAASIITLLDETEQVLQVFAVNQLSLVVDAFWTEIADVLSKLYYFLI